MYYITEFGALKRKNGESLADFTKRFNKVYQKIPVEVKPPETTSMITFANAFDSKFSLWLRFAKPSTLIEMQEATIEVESNLLASNKLKAEEGRGSKEKRKVKEEKLASTSKALAAENKLDEMPNIIKHLVAKMSKLEIENKNNGKAIQESGNRNPTPFRKPFHSPQILQRPKKPTEDQNVHHPLNNYAKDDRQIEEDDDDAINMVGGLAEDTCLTIGEYEG